MKKKKAILSNVPALTPEQVKQASVQMPNLPTMYFNHSRIATSNYDLRIYFGQANITAMGQQTFVEQLCVILTPEFAATFKDTLKISLERYEALFGKIRPAPAALLLSAQTENTEPSKSAKHKKIN